MTYKINGVELTTQPTTGRWMPRSPVGISGDGHPTYPRVREYELRWGVLDQSSVNQIQQMFDMIGVSGTIVVTLPMRTGTSYVYQEFSGCTLFEPERGTYFSEHTTEFVMVVGNIQG